MPERASSNWAQLRKARTHVSSSSSHDKQPKASSSGLGWVPAWLCPGASTLGIPARKVLGSLPGLGQGRGAGGCAGPPRVRTKAAGLSLASRSFVPGGSRRALGRGLGAALGGRSQAGAPGRSARALLAADHRRRAPPAAREPACSLERDHRPRLRPRGGEGRRSGPGGEPSPARSHGEVPGRAKASPAGPPVRRGREDRGQSPVGQAKGRPVPSGSRMGCTDPPRSRALGSHRVWIPNEDALRVGFSN